MYEMMMLVSEKERMAKATRIEEDLFGRFKPELIPAYEQAAKLSYRGTVVRTEQATSTTSQDPEPSTSVNEVVAVVSATRPRQLVRRFTLTNVNKIVVQVLTYGATISAIKVPDKENKIEDIVLGFDSPEDYYTHDVYFGSTIGRVANRIEHGKFTVNGRTHQLACNNGLHHLHGGIKGFDKVLWDSHIDGNILILSHKSRSNDEGYPGEVKAKVSFNLTPENELIVRYRAKASRHTPINLTNHSYFNLSGMVAENIKDHIININADHYLPVDKTLIPTGEIAPVEGTVFDLRNPTRLGDILPNVPGGGYDHNFCVNLDDSPKPAEAKPEPEARPEPDSRSDDTDSRSSSGDELEVTSFVAKVVHPPTGRVLEVHSSLPGVQFYTANFFPDDDSLIGKANVTYHKHSGLCLETQYYPNSVNTPKFPSIIFGPERVFKAMTVFKFSTLQEPTAAE